MKIIHKLWNTAANRWMNRITDRALSSYSTLTQSLDPASRHDIARYQTWISKHAPIVDQESAFIHHDHKDLAALPAPSHSFPSTSTTSTTSSSNTTDDTPLFPQQATPVVISIFILLACIVVFKFVPQIFARLVIALVTGFASYCTMPPAMRKGLRERRGGWKRAVGGYAMVMVALAVVVD